MLQQNSAAARERLEVVQLRLEIRKRKTTGSTKQENQPGMCGTQSSYGWKGLVGTEKEPPVPGEEEREYGWHATGRRGCAR